MSNLTSIAEPAKMYVAGPGTYRKPTRFALFNLGFRPFYLAGALFAAIAIGIWLAVLHGAPARGGYLLAIDPIGWHAHEMVFGFAASILVGFLLTAVRAWTGQPTPSGRPLAMLVLLWFAARVLVWSGPAIPAAVVDAAFVPLAALMLMRVLLKAGNRRNYFLVPVLGVFGALNVLFHIAAIAGRPDLALSTVYAAIGVVIRFVTVIGGRVIPMFSANAVSGYEARRFAFVERVIGPATVLPLFADAAHANHGIVFVLAAIAFGLHAARVVGWKSFLIRGPAILTILHRAYAWIPVGFALLALSAIGWITHSLAVHALTFGAIGGAIIAMITRTARGHTARPLQADAFDVCAYHLVMLGAVVRVFGPWFAPSGYAQWILAAGACWCAAFLLYVGAYGKALCRPRADGKPG